MPKTPLFGSSWSILIPVMLAVGIFVFLFNSYRLGRLKFNLSYRAQLILSVAIILLANIIGELLDHWIYRSAGFVLCGLIYIIHPVLPKGAEVSERTLRWPRLASVLLILIGIFTRVYPS